MIAVVGGHSRNVGKTSVMANIIAAFQELEWTAIKITQFGHSVCAANGEDCGCATDPDHPYALSRESNRDGKTDTSRYLAAGAHESFWLRTRAGDLGFALPTLRRLLWRRENVIVESNSILQFVRPDVYLAVLDPANPDFKKSSLRYLDRADAVLLNAGGEPEWPEVAPRLLGIRPRFLLGQGFALPDDFREWFRAREPLAIKHVEHLPRLHLRNGRASNVGPFPS